MGVIIIKPLDDALRDGDVVRAVIRVSSHPVSPFFTIQPEALDHVVCQSHHVLRSCQPPLSSLPTKPDTHMPILTLYTVDRSLI